MFHAIFKQKEGMIRMKKYNVNVSYVFNVDIVLRAENKEEAREYAMLHCGFTVDRGFHSTLPEEDLIDWEHSTHPIKIINNVYKIKRG